MISHHFEYHAPTLLSDAVSLIAQYGNRAAVMSGGTWLVPNMTNGDHQPDLVLDTKRLGLDCIWEDGAEIVIGTRVTYSQVMASDLIRSHVPLLAAMAAQITGGPQIVGQGTIGGSACYANPSSDVPACLVALDARMITHSQDGTRAVSAVKFFIGAFRTALRSNEMLGEVRIPKMSGDGSFGYHKVKFGTGSWPIVTAACVSFVSTTATVVHRIAIGAANSIPVCIEALLPNNADQQQLKVLTEQAGELIVDEWQDEFAGSGYRRKVAPSIALRAIQQSIGMLR